MNWIFWKTLEMFRPRRTGASKDVDALRRTLLDQTGVASVDSVRLIRGVSRRPQLLVRIRIAEGCDAREVIGSAAGALLRNPVVGKICVLGSASDKNMSKDSADGQ